MHYDVIVIGAGLSGLSAASLLARRGLKVAVVEHADQPGGSCGIFKREGAIFDQGAAMLYGFGEHGFNAHRFLFNCLEEPFEVTRHELLYVVHYNGKQIRFWPDVERFIVELSAAFPGQAQNIRRFYTQMKKLYTHVISETPSYTTPDETNPKEALRSVLKHPVSYMKFLSHLNRSAEELLKTYFTDPDILRFFDKLTSTYCYATVAEAPAIMASVMFVDNHEGGSYYPCGSTLFLPGTLEKVIEEHGGDMYYGSTVEKLLAGSGLPDGVLLQNGTSLYADQLIYSGTVWNLYQSLLPDSMVTAKERQWAAEQVPTYPSVVLYALVKRSVIPEGTCPIEMLAANPDAIDESEITVYLFSIDDHTLCAPDLHTVTAIGPSLREWPPQDPALYAIQKQEEIKRLTGVLDQRFPGFEAGVVFCELAAPHTIERYTLKNAGAVAGPKQMLGQHLLKRQPIRTRWETLYCCGESTTMGTGTPTVTTSGIAAANAALKSCGMRPYVWKSGMQNYVHIRKPPVEQDWIRECYSAGDAGLMSLAGKCLYCTHPACCSREILDIPGIMRRVSCGNFIGAAKAVRGADGTVDTHLLTTCEERCIQAQTPQQAVEIVRIIDAVLQKAPCSERAAVT